MRTCPSSTTSMVALVLAVLAVLALLGLLAPLGLAPPVSAAAVPLAADTEFLVLTHADFIAEFERLAQVRSAQGIPTEVLSLTEIPSTVPGDPPARMRAFLQEARSATSLRAVLLGGDRDRIPTRDVMRAGQGAAISSGALGTDLYFAALDGTWDADGDGVFGELPWRLPPDVDPEDDLVDLVADLQVGRAPVTTADEARVFVDRVLAVDSFAATADHDRTLILASNDPLGASDTFFRVSDTIVTEAGWPSERVTRLHADETASAPVELLTTDSALAAWDSGTHGLVVHLGAASAEVLEFGPTFMGWGNWSQAQTDALTNATQLPVLLTLAGQAVHDEHQLLAGTLLREGGGAAAVVGFSGSVYMVPARDLVRRLAVAFGDHSTIGEAFLAVQQAVAVEVEGSVASDGLLAWTLLGDPTMPSPTWLGPTATQPVEGPAKVRRVEIVPNPFNPRTEIHYELIAERAQRVRMSVHDLRGRTVRALFDDDVEPGARSLSWDGRDDGGRSLGSSVYVLRIEAGTEVLRRKLTLVR